MAEDAREQMAFSEVKSAGGTGRKRSVVSKTEKTVGRDGTYFSTLLDWDPSSNTYIKIFETFYTSVLLFGK